MAKQRMPGHLVFIKNDLFTSEQFCLLGCNAVLYLLLAGFLLGLIFDPEIGRDMCLRNVV
jgi:hypothetical protein